jgi:hypothetical protein
MSCKKVTISCLATALTLTLTVPASAAGEASGSVAILKAGRITPTHAAAYLTRDPKNARTRIVEVVLSDRPIDAAAAIQALNPHTDVINQDALKGRDYVLLWVRSDGEVSMNATFGESMTQYVEVSGGALTASLTTNTLDRVAGRLFTVKPVTVMGGGSYTVDLTFATDVTRVTAGETLPAGGGDPGKALTAFVGAVAEKKWPAIQSGSSERALKFFAADYRNEAENADYTYDLIQAWLPKAKLTVTGGEVRGDIADLDVEGEMFPGTTGVYVARMVKQGSAWAFDGATVLGMVP